MSTTIRAGLTTPAATFSRSLGSSDVRPEHGSQALLQQPSAFEPGARRGPPPFLDAAASALGLSPQDLDEELQSGHSLSSLAEAQGLSSDSLRQAIAADVQQRTGATEDQANAIAERLINGPPAQPPEAGSHRPPFIDAAAQALGLSADELDERLRAGESLSDLASASGVSTDDLAAALATDFQQRHPEASTEQAAAVAASVIEGPGHPLQSFRVSQVRLQSLSPT